MRPPRFDGGELPAAKQTPDCGFGKPGIADGFFDGEKELVLYRHVSRSRDEGLQDQRGHLSKRLRAECCVYEKRES